MKSVIPFALLVLMSVQGISQELRGVTHLSSRSSSQAQSAPVAQKEKAMKYGNVEAYDAENNLVGSVLTDENGNYTLNFKDSGTYTIKVMYAGYETQTETVKVVDVVEEDFSLDRDLSKKERVLSEKSYSIDAGYLGDKVILSDNNKQVNQSGSSEGLTSGEINDFAKWDLWNDYLKTDLQEYQKFSAFRFKVLRIHLKTFLSEPISKRPILINLCVRQKF